ncbi:MAG TPA: hypothetical protein PKD12_23740 [Nitrospira sp.]|nr:hypothetical protein [Nitrospira sp.]
MIHCETEDRVLAVIAHSPSATLDDVVLPCPDLTWNQVLRAIDGSVERGDADDCEEPWCLHIPPVRTLR